MQVASAIPQSRLIAGECEGLLRQLKSRLQMCEMHKKNPRVNLTKSYKIYRGGITQGDNLPIAHKQNQNQERQSIAMEIKRLIDLAF